MSKGKTGWRNRIVGSGDEDPAQLLANPLNFRTHPPQQRKGLAGALSDVGWVGRVIVNQRTGKAWPEGERNVPTLVDGHLRVELAMQTGDRVPVDYVDLEPREERLVLASYDAITGMAEADVEALSALLDLTETADQHLAGVVENLALEAGLYSGGQDNGGGQGGEETLLDQAIQLKPTREYVVVMCADGDAGDREFQSLRDAFALGMVRRGGYKEGSPFDAVGVQRVIHADFVLGVLRGLVEKTEGVE